MYFKYLLRDFGINLNDFSNLLPGFRESAFAYAISAAGVSHSVDRACSQVRLLSCGCDPSINRKGLSKSLRESLEREKKLFLDNVEDHNFIVDKHMEQLQHIDNIKDNDVLKKKLKLKMANRWKWGGCSHNMDFGIEFSEMFLDSREKAGDIQSQINLHNNQVGRLVSQKYFYLIVFLKLKQFFRLLKTICKFVVNAMECPVVAN